MSSHRDGEHIDEDPGILAAGTPIGRNPRAEPPDPVCIPPDIRSKHVHIIGTTGVGKSTLMEAMILDDIRHGEGVLVLDPHGGVTKRLLHLLPREAIERTIHFNLNDPDWVPIWNPLHCCSSRDRSRLADGLAYALVDARVSCSDRVTHLLRQVFFGLLHLPEASLLDAAKLLRKSSSDGQKLRTRLLEAVNDESAVNFWRHDFDCYTRADLGITRFLLSKLLMARNVSAMLSQRESLFSLRGVMDDGMVLLVDLSTVGPEITGILGGLMLSLLHMTPIGRARDAQRALRQSHVYCDEANRFVNGSLEDLLSDARRSAIDFVLAHQYMSQFNTCVTGVLSAVGSTLSLRVGREDVEFLAGGLHGRISADELTRLEAGQVIARISRQVLRLETFRPLPIPELHFHDQIIARCHERYYLPFERVLRALR